MVIESWAGKTPNEIAIELNCHPKTVRVHLARFNAQGTIGLGMREGAGRNPRLTEQERSRILALVQQPPPGKLERYAETLEARDENGSAQWSLDALAAPQVRPAHELQAGTPADGQHTRLGQAELLCT